MIKLKMLFASSLLLLVSACATVEVPNFKVFVTLPASGDGFGVETVTRKETLIPANEWETKRKRGIVILAEDYKILKSVIRKNCHTNKCTEALGKLDNLFLVIDETLQVIP